MNISDHTLNILLFGATGRTGSQFLQMALDEGHRVTVVVRSLAKIKNTHPNLTITQGDVMQLQSFRSMVHGQDAIISCIGESSTEPTALYSQGTANILAVMMETGISRIMCISAAAIETSPKLSPVLRLISRYVIQRIFRHPYSDAHRMEALLRNSDTEWTSIRPPILKDKAPTWHYRFAVNEWLDKCVSINRADLAYFILENITNTQTYKSVVEVAN